jgi:hypothetical protein
MRISNVIHSDIVEATQTPLHTEKIKNRKSDQIRILRFCFINHAITTFQTVIYNSGDTSFAIYLICKQSLKASLRR